MSDNGLHDLRCVQNRIIGVRALDRQVLAVAVMGTSNDWAAYISAVRGENHEQEALGVALKGCKLREDVAKAIFPAIAGDEKLRYRP